MIAKDPAQRYQTPREVADALASFCKGSQNPAVAVVASARKAVTAAAVVEIEDNKKEPHAALNRRSWWKLNLTAAAAVLVLGLVLGIVVLVSTREAQYLSDMAEFDVDVAEGIFATKGNLGYQAGKPPSGRIVVNGKGSPNGLSMWPNSNMHASVKYSLEKKARTFIAAVALNDSACAPGYLPGNGKIPTPLTFQVLGDDRLLWQSKPVDTARQVQECKIDVSGVDVLELRVDCPGSYVNAHAVWLEPRALLKWWAGLNFEEHSSDFSKSTKKR